MGPVFSLVGLGRLWRVCRILNEGINRRGPDSGYTSG